MPQVRIDLVGDANTLINQIGIVNRSIRELERSAADVYAMRGDAGMVGLQRNIETAKARLDELKTALRDAISVPATNLDLSQQINQLVGIKAGFNDAREAASAFRNETRSGDPSTLAQMDNARRQADAQAYLDNVRQKSNQQQIQAIAAEQAAFSKALQDKQRQLTAFYKEQDKLQKEQMDMAQKFAPSSPANQQLVEQKRQYDAITAAGEKQAAIERTKYQAALQTLKAYNEQVDAL